MDFLVNKIPVCKLAAPFPSSSSLKVVLSIKRVTHPSQKNLLCLLDYIFCAYQNLMIANFCILTTETRDVMGPQGIVSSSKLLGEIPGQSLCHHSYLHSRPHQAKKKLFRFGYRLLNSLFIFFFVHDKHPRNMIKLFQKRWYKKQHLFWM